MDTELMLDVGQANEIKLAARRAGATKADLKQLSKGDTFAQILPVIRGAAKVVLIECLRYVGTVSLEAVTEHKTTDCFKSRGRDRDRIHFWRDKTLDSPWIPRERHARGAGVCRLHILNRPSSSREMAAAILGVGTKISEAKLHHLLVVDGHCIEMRQIECLIERTEAGEEHTGLAKDGRATLFFVDHYDETTSIVIVYWESDFGGWEVNTSILTDNYRWPPNDRVLTCGMGT